MYGVSNRSISYFCPLQIAKNSPVWKVLARKNDLDMQLYEYIETLFIEQKEVIEAYEDSLR